MIGVVIGGVIVGDVVVGGGVVCDVVVGGGVVGDVVVAGVVVGDVVVGGGVVCDVVVGGGVVGSVLVTGVVVGDVVVGGVVIAKGAVIVDTMIVSFLPPTVRPTASPIVSMVSTKAAAMAITAFVFKAMNLFKFSLRLSYATV